MVKRKVKIEKNTVQETLVIPLYGKAWAVRNYPDIFKDTDCKALMAALDYDFSRAEKERKKHRDEARFPCHRDEAVRACAGSKRIFERSSECAHRQYGLRFGYDGTSGGQRDVPLCQCGFPERHRSA